MLYRKEFEPDPVPYRQSRTLLKNEYKVKIIAWDRSAKRPKIENIEGIEIQNVRVKCSYGAPFHLLVKILFFYLKVLKKLAKEKFDFLHCHDIHTIPIGFLVSKLLQKRVIYDVHDFYFDRKNRVIKKIMQKIDAFFASRVDYIIVPSPYFSDYYKRLNKHVKVIFNAPEKNLFIPKENYQSKIFTISYFGNVRWGKQLIDLMEATKNMKNVRIFIGGGGIKMEEIKEIAKNYKHVEVSGFVSYEKLINRYRQSDCIYAVYPSSNQVIKYSVPMKIFEAMACGLPVIANCEGYTGKFVRENKIGLCVEEGNLEQIKEAVIKLVNNVELQKELGKNGRKLVEKFYNWENMEKRLIEVYEKVLEK